MTRAASIQVPVGPRRHAFDAAAPGLLADAVELTKPGIVKMVLVTSGLGFAVAALAGGLGLADAAWRLLACLVGVGAAAASANALNQAVEWRRDALMTRTAARPISGGRRSPRFGWVLGLGLGVAAGGALLVSVGWVASAVAVLTIVVYVGCYTPLKPVTPLATLVGAVPGAAPPLIGWAAASAGVSPFAGLDAAGPWSLFLIMLAWQMPHVIAIAWRHRADYAVGGYAVLPVIEPSGRRASRSAAAWSIVLLGSVFVPLVAMPELLTGWYLAVSLPPAGVMTWAGVRFARTLDDSDARRLFFASLAALPLILGGVLADVAATQVLGGSSASAAG